MLESLIITLREGVEAALAVGIILIYLRKTGRSGMIRPVALGIAAALAASLAAAAVIGRLRFNEEIAEGFLMIIAGVLLVTMIVWMARHARTLRHEIESKLERLVGGTGAAAGAGLFALTFFLVFREGVETVLLLAAVNLTSDGMLSFLGGLAGLALAVLFGVAFVKGSVRIDLARFFRVTSVVLSILAIQLFIGGAHELAEGGVIPLGRASMRIIGPIVKADALFMSALLSMPLILLLFSGRSRPVTPPAESGPERRLLLARARNERLWRSLASAAGLVIVFSLTGSYAFSRLPSSIDPPRLVEPADGRISIPVESVGDGRLHRFGVSDGGAVVRFFLLELPRGEMTASFDACEICGPSGYVQDAGRLVCLNCAADIVPSTVGLGGGCNPIPLRFRLEDGSVVIDPADLKEMAAEFAETAAE